MQSTSSANVKVAVRVRPLSGRERIAGCTENLITGGQQIIAGPDHAFTYDAVFDQGSTQSEVFENLVAPLTHLFTQGYNCTVLAYGQVNLLLFFWRRLFTSTSTCFYFYFKLT